MSILPENYVLERKAVKHARIKVNEHNTVRVIVPDSFSNQEIDSLINQKQKWIADKLAFFSNRSEAIKLHPTQILFLGERFNFFHFSDLKQKVIINHENKNIRSGLELLHPEIIKKWYKKGSEKINSGKIKFYSQKYGFTFNKVFIRAQKSKWGNCSPRKNLSFNWRLIKTPLSVIDYIVLHELIHTEILKHTKQFWMKLKLIYPEYKKAVNWLDKYGISLQSRNALTIAST